MLGIGENTRLLQRYEVIERACLRVTAGWAMATSAWEIKVMLGRHMWQEAQRADRLRTRLKELRSGPLAHDNRTGLAEVVDYAARATHGAEYITGMYGVVKQALLQAYRLHREMTDMALDDGTLEALSANIASLEEQSRWAEGVAGGGWRPGLNGGACDPWAATITAMLRAVGGVDGGQSEGVAGAAAGPPRPPFQRPHEQRLDGFTLRRDRDTPPEAMGEAWREYVFRTFMNEIGAADNVASLVFDAPPHLDWDCLYAIARHGWDEYRHASMGWQRLRDLGLEPTSFSLGTGTFEFRDSLSVVDRPRSFSSGGGGRAGREQPWVGPHSSGRQQQC